MLYNQVINCIQRNICNFMKILYYQTHKCHNLRAVNDKIQQFDIIFFSPFLLLFFFSIGKLILYVIIESRYIYIQVICRSSKGHC